jgi:hypothetical protein
MPIKKVTPEQQAIRNAQDKRVSDYIKEGKTLEEARALVLANRQTTN